MQSPFATNVVDVVIFVAKHHVTFPLFGETIELVNQFTTRANRAMPLHRSQCQGNPKKAGEQESETGRRKDSTTRVRYKNVPRTQPRASKK